MFFGVLRHFMLFCDVVWCSLMFYGVLWCSMMFYDVLCLKSIIFPFFEAYLRSFSCHFFLMSSQYSSRFWKWLCEILFQMCEFSLMPFLLSGSWEAAGWLLGGWVAFLNVHDWKFGQGRCGGRMGGRGAGGCEGCAGRAEGVQSPVGPQSH